MRSFERFLVPPWKSRGIGKNDWTSVVLCDIRLDPSYANTEMLTFLQLDGYGFLQNTNREKHPFVEAAEVE